MGRSVSAEGKPAEKRLYPLVKEFAADGVPVAVSCRVLKLSRQLYYRWLADPVTDAELVWPYRANAVLDAHREDSDFGYRLLAGEATTMGESMAERTSWRICRDNGWWSVSGKKRGRNVRRSGPPVHDDLVQRDFSAEAPHRLWLTNITEHHTGEGQLYPCAIKDVSSGRIIGYSIASPMKSRLVVAALNNAVARRGDVADCIVHSGRGRSFGHETSCTP